MANEEEYILKGLPRPLFGNNGFYSLNNLKVLAILDFFCIFVAKNVQ
jgi:hypothetical protein